MGNNIEDLIETCGRITEEKGFDVSKKPEQVLLMVTELGEALEEIEINEGDDVNGFEEIKLHCMFESVKNVSHQIEEIRKNSETDLGYHIEDYEHFIEELADVIIRIFSFVYGNDSKELFIEQLLQKMETNSNREDLHGKKM